MTNQSEGRKPKLTWEEVRWGVFVPTESADIQVKATLDGRYHAFGDELSDDPYLLWGADNLLDAKVACEEWLEEKIRTYFPAARALGMLEPEGLKYDILDKEVLRSIQPDQMTIK